MKNGSIVIIKNIKSRWYNYVGKVIGNDDGVYYVVVSNTIEKFNKEDLDLWN